MPVVQYVLVADAARARLLSWNNDTSLEEVASFSHPESRLQNKELQSDGPGRTQALPAPRSAAEMPDAHRVEAERFARELADAVRDARVQNSYDELVVVAPPKFLGMLREMFDTPTSRTIVRSLSNDFTHVATHDLGPALRRHLVSAEEAAQDQT